MNLHELLLNPGSRLPFRCELSTDRLDFPAVLSYTAAPVGEGFIVNNAGALTLRCAAYATGAPPSLTGK